METGFENLELEIYFPTLIYRYQVPDAEALNETLLSVIYAEQEIDREGVDFSNFPALGGWHSRLDLHQSDAFAALCGHIKTATGNISKLCNYHESSELYLQNLWAIVNAPGSLNSAHVHPGSLWSGVYYVQTPENCGKIRFSDPRQGNMIQNHKFNLSEPTPWYALKMIDYEPIAGRMLLFPSWLSHSVLPNLSDAPSAAGNRVIVSFNMDQRAKRETAGDAPDD